MAISKETSWQIHVYYKNQGISSRSEAEEIKNLVETLLGIRAYIHTTIEHYCEYCNREITLDPIVERECPKCNKLICDYCSESNDNRELCCDKCAQLDV